MYRPALGLAALVPVAALLITQYPMIRNMGLHSSAKTSDVSENPVTRWKRVRLQSDKDMDTALPVLGDMLRYPEAAQSITELTFDPLRPAHLFGHVGEGVLSTIVVPETPSEDESLLLKAVEAVGLEPKLEEEMKKALIWKTRESEAEKAASTGLFSKERAILRHREAKYADALAILFCSLSPNLAVLRTIEPPQAFEAFLTTINYRWASSKADSTTALANLAQVLLIDSRWKDTLNDERFYRWSNPLDFIRKFHRLPSLTAFSSTVLDDQKADINYLPPGLSSLKSISVTHSSLGSQVMGTLIRLATSLENVTLTYGGRSCSDDSTSLVFAKTLGKCLEQHKDTLRNLDLDLDYPLWNGGAQDMAEEQEDMHEDQVAIDVMRAEDEHWAKDEQDSKAGGYTLLSRDLPDTKKYGTTIGSFADFQKLESLKIGVNMLLGSAGGKTTTPPPANLIQMLPPSLKHLTVRGYQKGKIAEYDRQVEQFLQEKETNLPLLKSIEGLDKEIPSGEPAYDPEDFGIEEDDEFPPLYKEPHVETDWLEADVKE